MHFSVFSIVLKRAAGVLSKIYISSSKRNDVRYDISLSFSAWLDEISPATMASDALIISYLKENLVPHSLRCCIVCDCNVNRNLRNVKSISDFII